MMAINFTAPPKEAPPKPTGTKAVVTQTITGKLPGMIKAAAEKLANAATAAEVLDVIDATGLAYDASKRAGRIAKAKGAHDTVVAAAHRAQADALDIEAAAKRRLADEYDAAQVSGDAQKPGRPKNASDGNNKSTTLDEVGLSRKQVFNARQIRDAEKVSPGVVRNALDQAIADGQEPSRAVVNEAVAEALGEERPKRERPVDPLQSAWDAAGDADRDAFLARNNLQFKADPADAAVTAGNDLREPASAVSGRIIREGDAPRKASNGEARKGADPGTEFKRKPLREHCLNPDLCAGSGREHCHACKKAMASEAA